MALLFSCWFVWKYITNENIRQNFTFAFVLIAISHIRKRWKNSVTCFECLFIILAPQFLWKKRSLFRRAVEWVCIIMYVSWKTRVSKKPADINYVGLSNFIICLRSIIHGQIFSFSTRNELNIYLSWWFERPIKSQWAERRPWQRHAPASWLANFKIRAIFEVMEGDFSSEIF